MSRKRRTIIKRYINLNSQQFEFSVNCPYSACLSRLRDLDATLKLRHELLVQNSKKGSIDTTPPSIEINDLGESATFAWRSGRSNTFILQGTVQAVTSENSRFVGTLFYGQQILPLLLAGLILSAFAVYPLLSAYVAPASLSWMAAVDTRCVIGVFGVPAVLVIGVLILTLLQLDHTLKTLLSTFDDC